MGHAKKLLGNFALSPDAAFNREGFPAFRRDWKEQYLQMLLTNTTSNTFYVSEKELCKDALSLHHFAADEDPFFMARALVYARNEGFMRLQPLVGLAVLSQTSQSMFENVFDRVVRIVPDLAEFTLAIESLGRGQGGRAVKRAAGCFLNGLDEYAVIKYAGSGRGYSLRDLLRVYHPKAAGEKEQFLFACALGKLSWDEEARRQLPQLDAYERLKKLDAGQLQDALQLIRAGRIPDNVVTGVVKTTPDVWRALLPDMPLFSLLRHLVTLTRNGVLGKERNESVFSRLTDAGAIKGAKIFPFRFAQAWRELSQTYRYGGYGDEPVQALGECIGLKTDHAQNGSHDWWLLDALEQAVEASVDAMPDLPGRTAVMLDVSVSMDGRFIQAGSVLALSLLKKTGGRGRFMIFNTECEDVTVDASETIIRASSRLHARGGTDTGVCLKRLTAEKDFCDTIIIVTDEQQNRGATFYSKLSDYRKQVNPNAQAFIVDVAPYTTAMTPPVDEKTWYCCGWSDQIISLIAMATRGFGDLVQTVSQIPLANESVKRYA